MTASQIYEVFLKADGKSEFRHVGALGAADNEMALLLARECYCRRAEGEQIWVVRRDDISSADSSETRQTATNRIDIMMESLLRSTDDNCEKARDSRIN